MRRLKPATGLRKIQPKGCNAKKTNKHTTLEKISLSNSYLDKEPTTPPVIKKSTT